MSASTGRACSICSHPERAEIERRLLGGEALRKISGTTGTTPQSLMRHRDGHMSRSITAAVQRERQADADKHDDDLLGELKTLTQQVKGLAAAAYKNGDIRAAVAAVTSAAKMVETRAKLTGQIAPTTVNVLVSAEFKTVQVALLGALEPFPDAKRAVIDALARIE